MPSIGASKMMEKNNASPYVNKMWDMVSFACKKKIRNVRLENEGLRVIGGGPARGDLLIMSGKA